MKKFIIPILLLLMFIPIYVSAETCDNNKISISSITIKEKTNVEEITEATANEKNLNLNLFMSNVGDSITYKIVVKNDSNEDYELDKNSFNKRSEYIDYVLESNDNSNIIKKNSSKVIYLKVEYKNEVPEDKFESGSFNDNQTMIINLSTGNTVLDTLKNPNTGNSLLFLSLLILIISGASFIILRKTKYTKYMILIIGITVTIPISVYALCKSTINIDSRITISKVKPNPCTFEGELVQGAEYVNGQYTYRYMQEVNWDSWQNIESDGWGVVLTDKDSTEDVTSKLCTSINDKPIVSMRSMFLNSKTTNIDASSFDTRNVNSFNDMFAFAGGNSTTFKIEGLSNWDTSNVEDMSDMFYITGVNAESFVLDLSKWDTSKVKNMYAMFHAAGQNATTWSVGDLSNWNTSKVTDMAYMFVCVGMNTTTFKLENINNWDTSNVTNMRNMFASSGEYATTWSIGDLSNWNTSKVTDMSGMFSSAGQQATTWKSIGNLNVYASNIHGMFQTTSNAKATLNIYNNPTDYGLLFMDAATSSGSGITINYTSNVTNIDNIINTKSNNSNVTKGSLIN